MALGRGLGAILDDVEKSYARDFVDRVQEIKIDKIIPNPYQPRKTFSEESLKELAESIKQQGLIQPIIVVKDDEDYILIAGERRLRAHKLLKKDTIKAIIVDFDLSKLREYAIIENLHREDLNPIEKAVAYRQLIDTFKLTQDEVAHV